MDVQYVRSVSVKQENVKKPIHLSELDALSVLYCMMILFVHASSVVISTYDPSTVFYQATYALWKISMSAIYGFIFISGIKLVLSQTGKFRPLRYYRSRVVKILVPYFVFTLLYYLVALVQDGAEFRIMDLLRYIINGQASAQLYFIVVLTVFYLFAPLWKVIVERIHGAITIPLLAAASLFVLFVYPDFSYQDNVFFKCLPFWITGCYIGQWYKSNDAQSKRASFRRLKWPFRIVFAISTVIYAVYACALHESGTLRSGLLAMVYAVIFIAFTYAVTARYYKNHRSYAVKSAARYTYFVFLDHCFFVMLANRLLPDVGIGYHVLRLIFITVCSWLVAYLSYHVYTYIITRGFGIKKLLFSLLNRVTIVSFLILLQLFFIGAFVFHFYDYYLYYYTLISLVGVIVCIYIINTESNPSYQIAWITVVLGLHLFGLLLYIVFHGGTLTKATKRKMLAITEGIKTKLSDGSECLEHIRASDEDAAIQSSYIKKYAFCPPYDNSSSRYFSSGEEMFESLFEEMKQAEKYIFLEFFIFKPGKIFDKLTEILIQKAKSGVDIRILYDDVGCIRHMTHKQLQPLIKAGIRIKSFNPYVPVLSALLNNRDHRKIVSIDGRVAFTGGVNVADEYANIDSPFGHWKDAAIQVRGEAAWSFTVMFLSNWNYLSARKRTALLDYEAYRPRTWDIKPDIGYIQPYTDSPLDTENVSETIYLNMISRASRYVYISSPYLALNHELITAICNAAKSGVDVRIVVPGIPDKRIVNQVTKSYYETFTKHGVKIYEYTPGFNHAKVFICDDKYATVGSVNLDFRSLYLSFECGVWLNRSPEISKILSDYQDMLLSSQEITYEMTKRVKLPVRIFRAVLRFFSPLM